MGATRVQMLRYVEPDSPEFRHRFRPNGDPQYFTVLGDQVQTRSLQPGKVSPPSSNSASESGSVRGIAPSPAYGSVAAMGPPQAWRNHNAAGSAPNNAFAGAGRRLS